ncbi:hypothetical protein TNCV_2221101 [Trichonephila clavipes]|nr:hypothetical protein TNCV_2221101 [Trichonephila clavipes]
MTTKHDASPQTRTPRPPYLSLSMMFEGRLRLPTSLSDEYAMRIATQTESALICKEYSSPFIVSPIPVFPAPQRTPSPMGRR